MKNRSALFVGLGILLIAIAAVFATVLGPRSDKLDASRPDVGNDLGIKATTTLGQTKSPSGGPTTIGGVGPTVVTTTVPFQLAEPDDSGASTTIPGPGPTFYTPTTRPKATTTTGRVVTTTTRPLPTTTTRLPYNQLPAPYTPDPATITSFCGINKSVGSLASLLRSTQFDDQAVLAAVTANLARYQQFAPPDAAAAMTALRGDFAQMVDLIAANGWKADSPGVLAVVTANSPPVSNIRNDDTIIQPIEDRVCGTS